jgi:hypothetical protein
MRFLGRLRSICRDSREHLGALSGILFYGGLVVGLFVCLQICEIVTITLLAGPKAYFAHGIRYADHHGHLLINGQAVPTLLHLLTIPLYLLLMPTWAILSLFVISRLARVKSRRRNGPG